MVDWVMVIAVGSSANVMLIGMILLFRRLLKRNEPIGADTLVALGLVLVVPAVLILAVMRALSAETCAALLGLSAGAALVRSRSGGA